MYCRFGLLAQIEFLIVLLNWHIDPNKLCKLCECLQYLQLEAGSYKRAQEGTGDQTKSAPEKR